MFVKNTTNEDIGPATFGGYEFTIPANRVSAILDEAGKHFTTHNFKVEAENPEAPNWKRTNSGALVNQGGDGGASVPPLVEVDASEWDGKTYAVVSRFKVDPTRIPNRNDMIRIAEERGVSEDFIKKATREGSTIDSEEIAEQINALPVPEEVRFPETVEDDEVEAPVEPTKLKAPVKAVAK